MINQTNIIFTRSIRTNAFLQSFLNFCRKKPLGAFGLAIIIVFMVVAIIGETFAPYDPLAVSADFKLKPPNATQWFGGDSLGRDIFSRVLIGTRISIIVGLAVISIGTTVGAILGIASAYYGGAVDMVLQRIVDALMAFPSLLLAICIMAVLGVSLTNVVIALALTNIPRSARTIRSVALAIANTDYALAATCIGASNFRLMSRHIAPNCVASFLVIGTAGLGIAIIAEASLSFLGIGSPEETITWGVMLSRSSLDSFAYAPHIGLFPGAALTLLVFGINIFGDAMRDVLDPRLRRTG
jgi:peptide/nickel transport system permease protein